MRTHSIIFHVVREPYNNREETRKLDFRAFHDRLWNCEVSLANDEAKQQYAWVHMQQLLNNMQSKRFEDSLYIVSKVGEGN